MIYFSLHGLSSSSSTILLEAETMRFPQHSSSFFEATEQVQINDPFLGKELNRP
jgi:hypothetical protein